MINNLSVSLGNNEYYSLPPLWHVVFQEIYCDLNVVERERERGRGKDRGEGERERNKRERIYLTKLEKLED